MTKVLTNKLGVFGGELLRWSVCMAVSCPGSQFVAVSCRVPFATSATFLQSCVGQVQIREMDLTTPYTLWCNTVSTMKI